MDDRQRVRAGQVFVAGGQPTVTYNPREELALESKVLDYLSTRYKILSIAGPTKAGKTVLLRRVVPDRVSIAGGELHSLDDFWNTVADELEVHTSEHVTTSTSEGSETQTTVGGGARPLGFGVSADHATASTAETTRERDTGRTRPARLAARDELRRSLPTVVIDDFHYVDPELQGQIIRGLKDLVYEGVGVILASVPHRSYDAVRVEKEMTGRVQHIDIPFWSTEELLAIPREGFAALNVTDPNGIAARLAGESFSSPLLMQDFCLQLVRDEGVDQALDEPVALHRRADWNAFFRERAASGSKPSFDLLSRGPRQRTDRKERTLRDGSTTDIYGAILKAIAYTGPLTELKYVQLRAALREVLEDEVPQQQDVTRVLEQMSKIARERIEGEPVVDYDSTLETLHISDPYFAFYLRWAVRPDAT